MKALVVYESYHHGNTEKIAKIIAETLQSECRCSADVSPAEMSNYTLVGWGSGIYAGRHHGALFDLIRALPPSTGCDAFVFSTSAFPELKVVWHHALIRALEKKGFVVTGSYSCKGLCTAGLFGCIGGVNEGRPNAGDFRTARRFARRMESP